MTANNKNNSTEYIVLVEKNIHETSVLIAQLHCKSSIIIICVIIFNFFFRHKAMKNLISKRRVLKYDGSCYIYTINHHLQEVRNGNAHDLVLTYRMDQD